MRIRSAALALAALSGSIIVVGALSNRPVARAQTAPPPAASADLAVQQLPRVALPTVITNTGPLDVRKGDKLSSELDQLQRADAASRFAAGHAITAADAPSLPDSLRTEVESNRLSLDGAGTVQVFVETDADPAGSLAATAAATAAGCQPDGDGDGCPDALELGANHLQGGDRDPTSPWDFFDVPSPALTASTTTGSRNRSVTIGDVIGILLYVGTLNGAGANANGVSYNTDINRNGVPDGQEYDRAGSSDPTKPWRSGPPSGAVTIADAITALSQVGDTCVT